MKHVCNACGGSRFRTVDKKMGLYECRSCSAARQNPGAPVHHVPKEAPERNDVREALTAVDLSKGDDHGFGMVVDSETRVEPIGEILKGAPFGGLELLAEIGKAGPRKSDIAGDMATFHRTMNDSSKADGHLSDFVNSVNSFAHTTGIPVESIIEHITNMAEARDPAIPCEAAIDELGIEEGLVKLAALQGRRIGDPEIEPPGLQLTDAEKANAIEMQPENPWSTQDIPVVRMKEGSDVK